MITSKSVAAQHDRRKAQLGMPYQTACGNLRKSLIFHMMKKLGEDNCYRCDKVIETENEMTLDHKKEWENVDAKLFFDVTNIAFSHAKCNRPKINELLSLARLGLKALLGVVVVRTLLAKTNLVKSVHVGMV